MRLPARWRDFLARSSFARNVLLLMGGSAAGQFLVVLASPLVTRLYTPDELGVFGVYLSIFEIALVFVSFRYDWAIPVPKEDTEAVNLLAHLTSWVVASDASADRFRRLFRGDA